MVLAAGTWIALTTLYVGGTNGGIAQEYGNFDEILFLQIALTENWLIFVTRAKGPFWSSLPSWQLTGAIACVDVIATCFAIWGWFEGGHKTHPLSIVRVWIFSAGVLFVMGGVYYLMQASEYFDNMMNGRSNDKKQRSLEDFGEYRSSCRCYRGA